MTRQDERMRLRKRLVERAIDHAAANEWEDAINDNLRVLELGQDADTLNRLGKAYLELGQYEKALEYYRDTLQLNRSNVVAQKNVARLEQLQGLDGGGIRSKQRQHADPQIFIVETGKTALTTLTNIAATDVVMRLTTGEQLEIDHDGKDVWLKDGEDRRIGQLEPQLATRLIKMLEGGNRYSVVVANLEAGLIKVLIREVYQSPEQRTAVSFPGKLGGDIAHFRTYVRDTPSLYDRDVEELSEDEELTEDEITEDADEDFFRGGSTDEEEVGLEAIEAGLNTDEDEEEES
jgi:tetratricopeptide (TPR) repeat protein